MKNSKPKTTKSCSIKIAIIAGIVLFILLLPEPAYALFGDVGKSILSWLTDLIFSIVGTATKIASFFFEKMLDIEFAKHKEVSEIGWKITRDLANMFFILFMVVIAFATILRLEEYGIKKLLPKVIGIALLINFSLVICYMVIDFSDIMAKFFISKAKNSTQKGGISGTLADSFNLGKLYIPADCKKARDQAKEECLKLPKEQKDQCLNDAEDNFLACRTAVKQAEREQIKDVAFLDLLVSMIFGSLVLALAAFTLFAGGILLLLRLVVLWFLVMVVPFVFICYIMPALRKIWQTWWSTFLRWCFFAPIFSFFIWLAVELSVKKKIHALSSSVGGSKPLPELHTDFFTSIDHLIAAIFTAALLLGGLIAANKMGIYGAGAAMKVGQKWGRGTGKWMARQGVRPLKTAGTAVGAGVLKAGGKLFGGKVGRRMKARATQLRQTAAERAEHRKYRAMAERMSNADLLKEVETAKGPRKLIATQIAERRGILREAERNTVREARKALRAFGATEEARRLEELRPDAIEDTTERKAAEERAYKEGIHKRWSGKVFEGVEGARVVEETREQLGTGEFVKVFKGWTKDVQNKAEEALRAGFTDNFTDTKNIERRKAHAAATGKAHQAFFGDQAGVIQARYRTDPNAQKQARIYIQTLKDEDFGNLKEDEDRALAATYMTPAQVYGAGTKLSGRHKNQMRRIAQRVNARAYKRMQRTDTWAT